MREAGEFEGGTSEGGVEGGGAGRVAAGAVVDGSPAGGGGPARVGRRSPHRGASGPRPVRPAGGSATVRPAPLPRPVCRAAAQPGRAPRGSRVLARRPLSAPPALALRFRVRRVVAGLLATVVTVAVVVGLGLLADAASAARAAAPAVSSSAGVPPAETMVTVRPGESLAAVARRAVPGADEAVVVARIVTANSLTSVSLRPGQVLRVPVG